jgi:pimeloyl-ACP methyl ester carboxylesterase
MTEPTFFGQPPLFGIHHPPTRTVASGGDAVLICPPLGHEHTRTHRALKLLGQALARAGHHVLRFDFRGLGDSWGQTEDGGVEEWCDDIDVALEELAARSGAKRLTLVGLRVGGALAAASLTRRRQGSLSAHRLILWDPVLSGREFLEAAMALESEFINDAGRFPAPTPVSRGIARRAPGDHLLGYAFPSPVRASLGSLDLTSLTPWPVGSTAIVLSRPSLGCETLVARVRASGLHIECEIIEGADGAWEDYAQHERTLRAGRLVPAIVGRARTEVA